MVPLRATTWTRRISFSALPTRRNRESQGTQRRSLPGCRLAGAGRLGRGATIRRGIAKSNMSTSARRRAATGYSTSLRTTRSWPVLLHGAGRVPRQRGLQDQHRPLVAARDQSSQAAKTGRNEPVGSECAYEDECVKIDGVWKFQRYFCEIRMCVTHQDGWGEKMVEFE
jgi:hypothetical protein